MGSQRGGVWTTLCPSCRRWVPIGDGVDGQFIDHPVNYAPWTGTTGRACITSGLAITEARAYAAAEADPPERPALDRFYRAWLTGVAASAASR